MSKTISLAGLFGATVAAATGAFVSWWWQSRSRQSDLEERTRVRLRRWQLR